MQKTVLKMENITKRFFALTALERVALELLEGEMGTIKIHDNPVEFHSTRDAEREGIEMNYQEIGLYADLSVAENIFLGNLPRKNPRFVNKKKTINLSREALNLIGLAVDVIERVGKLSTSQQQLVSKAKAQY
jgi:ABC-type sugar transport system ATPase subunit